MHGDIFPASAFLLFGCLVGFRNDEGAAVLTPLRCHNADSLSRYLGLLCRFDDGFFGHLSIFADDSAELFTVNGFFFDQHVH